MKPASHFPHGPFVAASSDAKVTGSTALFAFQEDDLDRELKRNPFDIRIQFISEKVLTTRVVGTNHRVLVQATTTCATSTCGGTRFVPANSS